MKTDRSAVFPPYEPLGWPRLLIALSTIAVMGWYMHWRLGTFNPDALWFSYLLYGAECLGVFTMLLHFFMVARMTNRVAPPAPQGRTVDVFIPTINEPVEIVRRTALKAMDMDYPHQTYILDDGNRPEILQLSIDLGCKYLARGSNEFAKAGNLNFGLAHSNGEFIAIFDADHAPKQNFLTRTLGYFTEPKVAFVQTPQDFYNLDSYQHSVERSSGRVWSEQALFFRVIQRGKDYWNAAFFCGSCAVVRRSALEAIGGFATGTITEDIHTSIRLHKFGFQSVYHHESLAFGIAPSQLEPFLKQRVRWGQGAMQTWRSEGVLFNRHLTLAQKLNYVASMITYFDGWQKFLYYMTPAIVLVTGLMPLVSTAPDFLLHFVPYFLMMAWCFEELGRGYGEMLIVEQYNMARFAAFCYSTAGLFKRKLRFRTTNKKLSGAEFNNWFLMPQYTVFVLNAVAIPIGIMLYNHFQHLSAFSLQVNLLWAALNLSLATMVLLFSQKRASFRRHNYRFSIPLVAKLRTAYDREVLTSIDDISSAGVLLMAPRELVLTSGDIISGELYLPQGVIPFQAAVQVLNRQRETRASQALGCAFVWKDEAAQLRLEQFLYGSDLEWQIHNLSEQSRTPLERITRKRNNAMRAWQKTKASNLSSIVMTQAAGQTAVNCGIVSMDAKTNRGTMMTFTPLPENHSFETTLFTGDGWKTMRAKVANQNQADTAGMYLYQLEATPA